MTRKNATEKSDLTDVGFITFLWNYLYNFHICTARLDTIESFIYPTDAQLDCSKNVKIYMRGAATCFGFSQPSSGSYSMCFANVIIINNQLKYVVYRNSLV